MKPTPDRRVGLLITGLFAFVVLLYGILSIPSKEGFNPSDDGVILAQSYRLLHGEVPHRDFISIRPVGSAVMHLIDFALPLPLERSARWLVLMEYLATAVLISLLLVRKWFRGLRSENYLAVLASSILFMFVMNQNHYNLFPWTTIDALFWFSLALYLAGSLPGEGTRGWLSQVLFWFSLTASALCRQTFALPSLVLGLFVFVRMLRNPPPGGRRSVPGMLAAIAAGLLPVWIYAGVLVFSGAFADFIRQMTGRTEFWQTGIVRFARTFWHSPMPVIFLAALFAGTVRKWMEEAGREPRGANRVLAMMKWGSFAVKVGLVLVVFLKPGYLFQASFGFFWLLVFDLMLIWLHAGKFPAWARPAGWILLAAWTSAISLGDNAPVFALGWLSGTSFLLQLKDFRDRYYRNLHPVQLVVAGLSIPVLLVLSLTTQMKVNYRDLPARQLTESGGSIFPGLSGIRLSPAMADYLREIRDRYESFGSPRGRFAVWPNNALIYPLLDSPDPFPLDWMQSAEFVGSEDRLMGSVRQVLGKPGLVILVEKENVKWLATGREALNRQSGDYPYLVLLDSLAERVETGSSRFDVYVTK